MEHFKFVLLILVIFAVFICLNNSGYFYKINEPFIVEGADTAVPDETPINVQELEAIGECQELDPPNQQCQGPCNEDQNVTWSRAVGSSWNRQSCTGETGNQMSWLNNSNKRLKLENLDIRPPDSIIDNELMIEKGDVFKYGDYIYIYRDDAAITYTEGEILPLVRYELDGGTEFCLKTLDNIPYKNITDLASSKINCSSSEGNWYTAINVNDYPISDINDCGGSIATTGQPELKGGEGTRHTHGCFIMDDDLLFPNCISEDETELKPKGWWKPIYENTNSIDELCMGVKPEVPRKWNAEGSRMGIFDTLQSTANTAQSELRAFYNTAEGEEKAASDLEADLSRLAINMEVIGSPSEELCNVEDQECGVGHYNENNHGRSTCNAYKIDGADINTASSVAEILAMGELSCNEGFKRIQQNRNLNINCNDGNLYFYGCVPSECIVPDEFEEKYQFKSDTEIKYPGDVFNINHIIHPLNRDKKIECKPGYSESESGIIMKCNNNENNPINGTVELSGCIQNTCTTPSFNETYSYQNNSDTNFISSDNFLEMNDSNRNNECEDDDDSKGPCFKCKAPNNYYIDPTLNPISSREKKILSIDEEQGDPNNYQFGPKISCENNQSDFIFEGCYENKCLNPGRRPDHLSEGNRLNGYVYDGENERKPSNFEDTENVSFNSHYDKYTLTVDLSEQPDSLNRSDLENKIKCGINFTNVGNEDTLSADQIRCYNFYDYKNRNQSEDKNIPAFTNPFNQDGDPIVDKAAIKSYLSENEGIPDKMYFSVKGCQENYCLMSVYDNNDQEKYKKPHHLRDSDNREVLGYLSEGINEPGIRKTARTYASINNDNQSTLQCDTGNPDVTTDNFSKECTFEGIYTNDEIDTMLTNVDTSLILYGQIGESLNSSINFEEVGRGGPFQIKRCWDRINQSEQPKITCTGTNCNDSENSECRVELSGCIQNRCKLHPDDAEGGTRILVQNEKNSHISVGGFDRDNINELFNVDQIRNITCDYNFSKEIPNQEIIIQCPNNSDYFEIQNKCTATQCEGDEIVDTIHIREKGYYRDNNEIISKTETGLFSICPNTDYTSSRSLLNIPSPVNMGDNSLTVDSGICSIIPSGEREILEKNLMRYSKGDNFNLGGANLSDIQCNSNQPDISSIGEAKASCNYTKNIIGLTEIPPPKYQLSQCQPRLCSYPTIVPDRVKYVGTRAINGEIDSIEMMNNEYTSNIFPEELPSFVTEESYIRKSVDDIRKFGGSVQCDETNYHGSVSADCLQDIDNYLSNDPVPEFTNFRGCVENECIIPNGSAPSDSPGKKAYDDLGEEEKQKWDNINEIYQLPVENFNNGQAFSTSLFSENICQSNFRRNQDVLIQCPSSPDGKEQLVDINGYSIFKNLIDIENETPYCIPNICTLSDSIIDDYDELNEIRQTTYTNDNNDIQEFILGASKKNPLEGYVVDGQKVSEMDHSTTTSELINIQCADNYRLVGSGPSVSCLGGSESSYTIEGCSENYCLFDDTIQYENDPSLYNFNIPKAYLKVLADKQENKLTVNQIKYGLNNSGISCSPLSEGSPTISCPVNGGQFTVSGCIQKTIPEYIPECTISYPYYPGNCIEKWPNTTIHISQSNGETVSITHDENGDIRDQAVAYQYMNEFMSECKRLCNINDECHGFSVIKIDEEAKDTYGTCSNSQYSSQSTCESNDETWTPYAELKVGTMICEQKSRSCGLERSENSWLHTYWDTEWGQSFVYATTLDSNREEISVVRPERISGRRHSFFEKKFNLDGEEVSNEECIP
ncbi:MAG: hypothetical protein CMG46_02780 [Candidatus Marinimicrobia bacterium]|nr:hypothetical protein [Candidatus Neomarinimicrobiota bacterium]